MYIENPGKVYGCYHCGEIMGEFTVADTGHYICASCGESAVITLETALDVMIKLQRQGHTFQSDYYDEEDAEVEIDPEELDALLEGDDS